MLRTCWLTTSQFSSKYSVTTSILNELRRHVASSSVQLAAVTERKQENEFRPKWDEAKSFKDIPGPNIILLLLNFLPGGKYYKRNLIEMNKILKEEYGDIVLFKGIFGNHDTLLCYNPKDFEEVYRTEGPWPHRGEFVTFQHFRKNIRPDVYQNNGGLLAEQGEKWKELRGKVNPVLMQPRIVKRYIKPVEEVTNEFIVKLLKLRDSNNELPSNATDEFNKWALESIAQIALDSRLGCLDENITSDSDSQRMIRSVHDFFECTYKLEVLPSIWQIVKTPTYYKLIRALDTMTTISLKKVDEAMKRIQDSPEQKADREASVLEKLLKIDRNGAIVMAMDMMLAGVDTTSYTSGFLLYFLATNQKAQDKLRQEILTILPEKDSKLSEESFNHIRYMRACMKEANRILPAAGGVIRKIPTDLVMAGYQIPKGTKVAMNHITATLDEKYFPKPEQFIPERWLKNDTSECPSARTAHPFSHMPFGFGPRSCIGKRFADLEVQVLITKLLRNYKVEWNYGELKVTSKLLNTPESPLRFKITEL